MRPCGAARAAPGRRTLEPAPRAHAAHPFRPPALRRPTPSAALPDRLASLAVLADVDPAAATAAADAATDAAAKDGGWLAPLANAFESFLGLLHTGLEAAHVPYSYGFAIILLTFLVKAATFPLTKKQMESTVAIQALQPRVKEIQDRCKGRPAEEAQVEVARLYKEAGVNPLAGCLPTLATLPVWIGLYRALSAAADDGLLSSGWFWIPSLAGPTSLAAQKAGAGSAWLFPLVDGAPPIGWHDAIAYLIMPVLLVATQAVSMRVMSPPSDDPAQKQTQAILKFLPLMIGWFSLNVPSGLTLYWLTNNVLSTAQSLWLKATIKPPAAAAAGAGFGGTVVNEPVIDIGPPKPSGGGAGAGAGCGGAPLAVRAPTRCRAAAPPSAAPVCACATAAPAGRERGAGRATARAARGRPHTREDQAAHALPTPHPPGRDLNARGKSRGATFQALKAKEAAKKAASQVGGGDDAGGGGSGSSAPPTTAIADKPRVPDAPPAP